MTGVPPENIEKAARWIGETDRAMGMHARGIEHQSKGVENCLAMINLFLATGNIGREGAGCMMITGQGNGQGGREHGQKVRSASRACARSPIPKLARYVAGVWGIDEEELPGAGYYRCRDHGGDPSGRDQGAVLDVLQSRGSLPDANFTREALSKLEFFGVIDFFHVGDSAPCRRGLRREPAGRRGGRHLQRGRPGTENQQSGRSAGRREVRRADHLRSGAKLGKGKYFRVSDSTREIYDELRRASHGGLADYYGIT